ncbi:sulfate transporter-like protein [Calycina marina]|uniref:Sulfate transporter-like protein n=1 Tax=Calycina marina TaxID=1763456 RepID=A0A9P7Z3K3_9HELO|nr:sulfate transporter-like protein [Calycina marina]
MSSSDQEEGRDGKYSEKLKRINRHNFETLMKDPLQEISGSLGDLGTLLPLMIALAINNSISLSTTLVFSGLWNIVTGLLFGIPLPVQPMKAIAAVAISRDFSIEETTSAGFTTSAFVLLISATGMLQKFTKHIPIPVVKGIQVGAGLSLVVSAGTSLLQPLHWVHPRADNLCWAIFVFLAFLATGRVKSIPYAFVMFGIGVILAIVVAGRERLPHFSPWVPRAYVPSVKQFSTGALEAGLGQIPLTTLNSIVAVVALAKQRFPDRETPGVTDVGVSVALMNLVGGWFGAMPVCHGSGGLAAQYGFGARSGASIVILGCFKMLLGLVFGESLIELLREYPRSLLGVMVVVAGLELVKVGEELNTKASDLVVDEDEDLISEASDHSSGSLTLAARTMKRKEYRRVSSKEGMNRWNVMLMTVGALLAFKNDGVGFLVGMLVHWTQAGLPEWIAEKIQGISQWTKKGVHRSDSDVSDGRQALLG